jgi:hypothetical protein
MFFGWEDENGGFLPPFFLVGTYSSTYRSFKIH